MITLFRRPAPLPPNWSRVTHSSETQRQREQAQRNADRLLAWRFRFRQATGQWPILPCFWRNTRANSAAFADNARDNLSGGGLGV